MPRDCIIIDRNDVPSVIVGLRNAANDQEAFIETVDKNAPPATKDLARAELRRWRRIATDLEGKL